MGEVEEFRTQLLQVLDRHYARLHQSLDDAWSDVDESNYVDSATTLKLQPQSQNDFRVDFVVGYVACAAAQAGFLELGDRHRFVVPANAVSNLQCKIRLANTDDRVLSIVTVAGGNPGTRGSGTAGFIALHLGGKEIPPGALRW